MLFELNKIYNEDCIETMKRIPDGTVDLMLTDPPYNTTNLEWEYAINFELLWKEWLRIVKPNGAFVFTASQPFTTDLIISNRALFKYELIWDKLQPSGQMTAKYMPMKVHENICVFYRERPTYNRQFTAREKQDIRVNAVKNKLNQKNKTAHAHLGGADNKYADDYDPLLVNPKSIITYSKQPDRKAFLHPTQKPVDLMRYLILTYTNEGDTVFDGYMGSGTTAEACIEEKRNYIGSEKNKKYYDDAIERIKEVQQQTSLF